MNRIENFIINVNCWGDQYIISLLKYAFPCLLRNLNLLKKNELAKLKIIICTTKSSKIFLKQNQIYNDLSKKIQCEIFEIDDLIKNLFPKTANKYQFLACIQSLIINYAYFKKYSYLMTLYPDFIFKDNTIKNLLKLSKSQDCDILVPIPQIIKERFDDEVTNDNFNETILNLEKLNFESLHDIILNNNINHLSTNTPSLFCQIEKDFIIFNNYHLHPILIKLSDNRFKYTPFVKSLDEDYVKSISYEKSFYVIKNSNELMINSLLGKDELKLVKYKYVEDLSVTWLNSMMYEINKKFSENSYVILKNNKIKPNLNKMTRWTKKINKKLNLKTNNNYTDTALFAKVNYFINIRNFTFSLFTKKHDEFEFNKLIDDNNLNDFRKFLKIFS